MTENSKHAILAIESSSKRLKLALQYGGDRLVKLDEKVNRSHGQVIIRKIEHLLESAALKKSEIGTVVAGIGPGSFTGLRIGLAVAKGIATALKASIVGVSHMELASYFLKNDFAHIMVVMPFKTDALFIVPMVDGQVDPAKVSVVGFEQLAGFVSSMPVAAIGFDPESQTFSAFHKAGIRLVSFDAADLIAVAETKITAKQFASIAELEPMYLQKSQAEIIYDQRHR